MQSTSVAKSDISEQPFLPGLKLGTDTRFVPHESTKRRVIAKARKLGIKPADILVEALKTIDCTKVEVSGYSNMVVIVSSKASEAALDAAFAQHNLPEKSGADLLDILLADTLADTPDEPSDAPALL